MKEIWRLLGYFGIALLMSGSVIGFIMLVTMLPEERVCPDNLRHYPSTLPDR